ncbi:MAG: hypothetical protein RLP98_17035 [Devosia sp.]
MSIGITPFRRFNSVAQVDENSNVCLAASTGLDELGKPIPAKKQFQRCKLCIGYR